MRSPEKRGSAGEGGGESGVGTSRRQKAEAACVWTVNEFCDRVTQRPIKALDKHERDQARMWGPNYGPDKSVKPALRFASEEEAWEFVLLRADKAHQAANAALDAAWKRYLKCEKRLQEVRRAPEGPLS